jgi:ribosomal protein RSM22 (predicted rRNA methylase)
LQLPRYLAASIEEITAGKRGNLSTASSALTGRYQAANFTNPALRSHQDRLAYLATRFPATFAAATSVLAELRRLAGKVEVATLLDLGSGPGTALLAAAEIFPALQTATLIELDPDWLQLGKQLFAHSPHAAARSAQCLQGNLVSHVNLPPSDIVVISYSLGELAPNQAIALLARAWKSTGQVLVIIEPGTMRGFANIDRARTALISTGAKILAPCPHTNVCPMAQAGDWCHFAQRVERTAQHRHAKGGSLGYEDEKFSYLIASRQLFNLVPARIVRHPQKHSGHVTLQLCTPEGLLQKTITKSNKEAYKRARQAKWGDDWEG